jgi:hypothetical protein
MEKTHVHNGHSKSPNFLPFDLKEARVRLSEFNHRVLEAADHLRTTTFTAVHRLVHDLDGGMTELGDAVRSEVKDNPIRAVLMAAGVGYILGGGLAAPVTRRLTRLALRAMLIPLLDEPTTRLWDWIRSDLSSGANPSAPLRQ